jgi:hypothetical protein
MSQEECKDDLSITAETRLFRRVHPNQLVTDENTGFCRLSSSVFKDVDLSVDIESIMRSIGKSPEACLTRNPHHKLIAVTAGAARGLQLAVCFSPTEDNPSHGLIYGPKSKATRYKLIEVSEWVIPPHAPRPQGGASI